MGNFSPLPHLFIQSFIRMWTYEYLFYTLDYTAFLHTFSGCHKISFNWLLCPFANPPWLCVCVGGAILWTLFQWHYKMLQVYLKHFLFSSWVSHVSKVFWCLLLPRGYIHSDTGVSLILR
jgi:hypothetical protein